MHKKDASIRPCYPDRDWKEFEPRIKMQKFNKRLRRSVKLGEMRKAEYLFEKVKREGYQPDVSAFATLMQGFRKTRNRFRRVFELYNEMKRARVTPNRHIFEILIKTCYKTASMRRAELLFSEMEESYGIKPDLHVYFALLKVCLKSGNVEKTKEIVKEMIERGIEKDASIYGTLVAVYAAAVDRSNGEKYLQECKEFLAQMQKKGFRLTSWTYNTLIKLCVRGGMPQEARKVIDEMKRNEVKASIHSYTMLMESYAETAKAGNGTEYLKLCRELMHEMEKDGCRVNCVAYNSIIKLCSAALMVDVADEVLEEMKEKGVAPTIHTYNMIISLYAKTTNPDNGEERLKQLRQLLDEMRRANVHPTYRTYKPIIHTCTDGKVMDISTVLKDMKQDEVEFDSGLYNLLIDYYAETAKPENGEKYLRMCRRLVNEMEMDGISANPLTRSSLFKLCARAKLKDEAFKVLGEIKKNGEESTIYTYTSLLCLYSGTADFENSEEHLARCKEILAEIRSKGIPLSNWLYSFPIKLCVRARMAEEAHKLFDEMKEDGIVPDVCSYSFMMELYAETTDVQNGAERLQQSRVMLDEMAKTGVPANSVVYNAIIKICNRARMVDKAFEVLEEMKAKGLAPSFHTYHMLLVLYAEVMGDVNREKRVQQSRQLLSEMQRDVIPMIPAVYNVVIVICIRARNVEEAFKVLDEMKEDGVSPIASTYIAFMNELLQPGNVAKERIASYVDRLWNVMLREGLPHNRTVFACLANACMTTGDLNNMAMYFEKMKAMGLNLPPNVYKQLVKFYEKNDILAQE